jgi:hypothetical protein
MTFRQWATANGLGDLPDVVYRYAEAGWQCAQTEERKRAGDLVAALKACDEAMDYMSEYDIPLTLPKQVKDAIAKYEESQ